jgi:hypothetical protein
VLNWAGGVSRFYWYAWDNQGVRVRMTESDEATSTPTAKAYAELQKWMVDARMESLRQDHGTWICQLSRGGAASFIVWNPDHKIDFERPRDVDTIRRLSGESTAISGNKVEIGPTPVLLDRATH